MGRIYTRTQTITRPANTTQYADGDAVSDSATTPTILTFDSVCPDFGKGAIVRSVMLHKNDQDLTSAAFDLYLFDTTVAAAGFDDNSAIAITDAEWLTCVGGIEFLAADGKNVVTGDMWNLTNLDLSFQCTTSDGGLTADDALYGVLVARDTYTPASGEVFTIRLAVEMED